MLPARIRHSAAAVSAIGWPPMRARLEMGRALLRCEIIRKVQNENLDWDAAGIGGARKKNAKKRNDTALASFRAQGPGGAAYCRRGSGNNSAMNLTKARLARPKSYGLSLY